MIRLLIDIGNTNTQFGLGDPSQVGRYMKVPTADLFLSKTTALLRKWTKGVEIHQACLCSVVPRMTQGMRHLVKAIWNVDTVVLTHRNVVWIGIDYPKPSSIGPDRLANSIAASRLYGAPVLVIDFGTAVTFDVVDSNNNYVGGIIAPGLAAMADYLHEKTALLPRIQIQETLAIIGKSTKEAMLIGAVHGYRGLVRELIHSLKKELNAKRLPVIATGGYARLIAASIPSITGVNKDLTLEGLRIFGEHRAGASTSRGNPHSSESNA